MAVRGGLEKLKALKILFGLAMAGAIVWSFHVPPAVDFQQPDLARIFVWHFPCPMIASILLMIAAWFQIQFLRSGHDRTWDVRGHTCLELAYLFSLLTMATGMLFSKVQWGAWWQWDPRQTSFLLVLMIYGAYFVLRSAFPDAERRAAAANTYALAALLPAMFLIFVYPRLPMVTSFHPTNSILEGKIKGEYAGSVTTVLTLVTILTVWLYRLGTRVGLVELELEKNDE